MTQATTTQPDPAVLAAHLNEANELVQALRNRCVALNLEVRSRDARITTLEALVAEAEVSGGDADA